MSDDIKIFVKDKINPSGSVGSYHADCTPGKTKKFLKLVEKEDNPTFWVCPRKEKGYRPTISDATTDTCFSCGKEIFVSPRRDKRIKAHIICVPCAVREEIVPPSILSRLT